MPVPNSKVEKYDKAGAPLAGVTSPKKGRIMYKFHCSNQIQAILCSDPTALL